MPRILPNELPPWFFEEARNKKEHTTPAIKWPEAMYQVGHSTEWEDYKASDEYIGWKAHPDRYVNQVKKEIEDAKKHGKTLSWRIASGNVSSRNKARRIAKKRTGKQTRKQQPRPAQKPAQKTPAVPTTIPPPPTPKPQEILPLPTIPIIPIATTPVKIETPTMPVFSDTSHDDYIPSYATLFDPRDGRDEIPSKTYPMPIVPTQIEQKHESQKIETQAHQDLTDEVAKFSVFKLAFVSGFIFYKTIPKPIVLLLTEHGFTKQKVSGRVRWVTSNIGKVREMIELLTKMGLQRVSLSYAQDQAKNSIAKELTNGTAIDVKINNPTSHRVFWECARFYERIFFTVENSTVHGKLELVFYFTMNVRSGFVKIRIPIDDNQQQLLREQARQCYGEIKKKVGRTFCFAHNFEQFFIVIGKQIITGDSYAYVSTIAQTPEIREKITDCMLYKNSELPTASMPAMPIIETFKKISKFVNRKAGYLRKLSVLFKCLDENNIDFGYLIEDPYHLPERPKTEILHVSGSAHQGLEFFMHQRRFLFVESMNIMRNLQNPVLHFNKYYSEIIDESGLITFVQYGDTRTC